MTTAITDISGNPSNFKIQASGSIRSRPLAEHGAGDKHGDAARRRLLSIPGEPLFIADWQRVLMMHYEVDAAAMQRVIPFELDLKQGRACVSMVAFTMRGMRPSFGGRWGAWLLAPISTHHFLNVRTYVRHEGEVGIYFMREWLANRLSVAIGPHAFGLPYRFAKIDYGRGETGEFAGRVRDGEEGGGVAFRAEWDSARGFNGCQPGSLCEWLMERYTAYTFRQGEGRFFRIWHRAWQQAPAKVEVEDQSLLERNWDFFRGAQFVGAHFSPGVFGVWMGWPHRLEKLGKPRRAVLSGFYEMP